MAKPLLTYIQGQPALAQLVQAGLKGKLPHALLFAGPSGVGKKKSAWALAQALLCTHSQKPCGECSACQRTARQTSESILFIQPEGLHIKIGEVRAVLDFLSLKSFAAARVIIIEAAHQMNRAAQSAVLKILEEPPEKAYFFLISSHPLQLSPAIRSRTQTARFIPLANIPKEEGTKDWMRTACQGRMDLLEQLKDKGTDRTQAFKLLHERLSGKIEPLNQLSDLVRDRSQALFMCMCWQQILRDACFQKLKHPNLIHTDCQKLIQFLQKIPSQTLHNLFMQTVQLEQDLKAYMNTAFAFDYALFNMRAKI